MKIVFANRYFFPDQSATSRMISSIAIALAQQGFDVAAVTSRNLHNDRNVVLPGEETISGVKISRLHTSHFGRQNIAGRAIDYFVFHIVAFFWLLRNISRSDIAVICTDPPFLSVTSAIVLRLRGAFMVNWIMDLFPETAIELGFLKRWRLVGMLAKRLRDWSLGKSAVIVCPTRTMADYIGRLDLPRTPVAIMHHWSDGNEIYPVDPAENSLRAQWGLADNFVVGYSGTFGRAHDFTTIIKAATLLKDRSDIRFLLIGSGFQHASVMELARRLDLKNIIFKPLQPIEHLAESLSAADVHLVSLLPSLEHCIIPSKFYGILAAARPTLFIGDPKGEVARVLAANECGKSIAVGDGDKLATIICELQGNPQRCAEMGQIARQLLGRDYSHDQAIATWGTLINRLQNSASSAPNTMQRQLL
jgi:glycosyltransferase involved in cell wall biosynthesis